MARSNRPAADAAPAEQPEAAADAAPAGLRVESSFEIVDNTAAEAAPAREAESSERELGNGMIVVDYR